MQLPITNLYNYHSHTQFCDGRASMEQMARAAADTNMEIWGFSPHSPICIESPCNMAYEDMDPFLAEASRLKENYLDKMTILTALEIDFISPDFGPHIDYFQNLPLDYRIGSVHFVPNQEGIPLDCDGKFERFKSYLKDGFNGDLRYVVEKFFEQELIMIERGGFDILGHFDKIAGNAALADPSLEEQDWYKALISDVIRHAHWAGLKVEINTKSLADKSRFFPANQFWNELFSEFADNKTDLGKSLLDPLNKSILVNSDAHYPEKVNAGRDEAFRIISTQLRPSPI